MEANQKTFIMKNNKLGNTDLNVSRLGLGGLFVSSHGAAFEDGKAAILRAFELGINYVDTAPTYADSEECLGRVLPHIETPLVISTKLGGRPSPFEPQNKTQLRASFEESLRLLNRESVDILMIHEPDRPGQYDWWTDAATASGPVVEFLQELKGEGRIKYCGLAGTTAYSMAHLIEAGEFDVVLTAFNFSLLWREAEHSVLAAAQKKNMGVIVGSPLQQGALARRWDAIETGARWLSPARQNQFRQLYALADEIALPLPELALRFCLSHPAVSTVLTGVCSVAEVEQNVAAAERGVLSAPVLQRLDEIAALVPFRPADEPWGLPFGRDYRGPGSL